MFRLSLVRRFSSSTKVLKELHLTPKEWLNLPAEEVLRLFKVRKAVLGGKWKRDDDELQALLKTSQSTGVSPREIRVLYEKGEVGAYELAGQSFEDDHTPQPFQYDEYPEPAQEIIRDHREQREYNRIAAYEMPHLVKYRQEYKPAEGNSKPVSYKYTTYLGEADFAANRKVSLSVKVNKLGLTDKEAHKFKVLAGARYDHTTDTLKMSTDRFQEPLQNTRFLSDTLNTLLKESKDLKDDFSDIPLDTRHTDKRLSRPKNREKAYKALRFPDSWKRPQDAPVVEKTVLDYVYELQAEKAAKTESA